MERKLKLCVYCNQMRPIFKNTELGKQCQNCYRKEQASKQVQKPRKKIPKVGKTKKQKMVLVADAKFSRYVKLLHSIDHSTDLALQCYTCGQYISFGSIHCGHYITRDNMFTRWLADNCRPQCYECNVTKEGNLKVFKEKLEAENPGITEQLEQLGRKVWTPSEDDVMNIIAKIEKEIVLLTKA